MLQAVLFDLDDTLLIGDNTELMRDYFTRLARRFAGRVEPRRLQQQIIESTLHTLTTADGSSTTIERFCEHFWRSLALAHDMQPFLDFYAGEYAELGRWTKPAAGARASVEAALALGLKIAVATNPLFPRSAIMHRLRWAGLDDLPWDLITSGEEMHYCKPHPGYFRETASRLGVPPSACLMVGNDPERDMPAARTGMTTFLVTAEVGQDNEALATFLSNQSAAREQDEYAPHYQGRLSELPALLARLAGKLHGGQ